ncbi:enoyl-CoA hydratase [Hellea balneolensis]|uniref:enoyl-CoA hydratase n=1 Tax=Hellea balneolensis TaxID=287478 RepID=UPI00040F95A4|nr:enoyl-CoA hydratase [Hellea balneolensis]
MPQKTDILQSELGPHGVLRLILNDNRRRNALSEAMLIALSRAIIEADQAPAIRVIIIASDGPAFCSGHDLKEITQHRNDPDEGQTFFSKLMQLCSELMQNVVNCSKPVIAEVEGTATAAGCQLVGSCDLAIASDTAVFSTPGVDIGLFCSTPMVALSRNIGSKQAMEMLLTGDRVSAEKAAEIGLINRAVTQDELRATVSELAEKIAAKSSLTLATGKAAFYAQKELNLAEAYAYTSEVMVKNMLRHDAKEGIEAFIEKRPPKWT